MVEPHRQLKLLDPADARRARRMFFWRSPYLIWGALSYALILVMMVVYLSQEPRFASNMALVLPGSGSTTSFQIDDVGAAKSQTKSPFSGASFNPRVNYKEILRSREVLQMASDKTLMNREAFGLPKVQLTQQTSILEVDVTASTASMAQQKAWALYEAFQSHLDTLRADESLRRDDSISAVLDQYRLRLSDTRNALIEFQERSLLVDKLQMEQLMTRLSDLRSELMFTKAEYKQRDDFVQQLSFDLGVSASMAGKAFALQTDTQFRGHLRELDQSSGEYSEFRSMWGNNHPKVKASEKRMKQARLAAFNRSSSMLGDVIAESLHGMNLEASPDRARLFSQLMDAYAHLQGSQAKIADLERSDLHLADRLRVYARESKELERLTREHDLAEAVFTSAAAQLESSKADVFASYPVVQMMTVPNEPYQQKSPKLKLAIAGAFAGMLLVSIALLIIWQRSYLISRLLSH